jgi:uncharacterized protein (DUF983 family)
LTHDPYRTPAAPLDTPDKRLTCPYCANRFPYTWKRYFKLRQVCPHCARKSKFGTGAAYWLVYVPVLVLIPPVVAFVGTSIISMVLVPDDPLWIALETHTIIGLWVVLYLLTLPVDRAIDLHFRKLVPVHEGDAA